MDIGQPHRGRTFQIRELLGAFWIETEGCELNLTLYKHLVNLGWRFAD